MRIYLIFCKFWTIWEVKISHQQLLYRYSEQFFPLLVRIKSLLFCASVVRNGMSKNSVAKRIESRKRTIMTMMAPTEPRYLIRKSENTNPTIPPSRKRRLLSPCPIIEKMALEANTRKNVPKTLKYSLCGVTPENRAMAPDQYKNRYDISAHTHYEEHESPQIRAEKSREITHRMVNF